MSVDAEAAAKALAAPAQRGRPRANRAESPRPGSSGPQTDEKLSGSTGAPKAETEPSTGQPEPQTAPSVTATDTAPADTAPQSESATATTDLPKPDDRKVESAPKQQQKPVAPPPKPNPRIAASGPVDAARVRLAARTAEQTFLPLVSRIAKLSEWVEQAVMAVADAKAAGVTGEHLADTLRGIARKNGTAYTDIPESVRISIEAEDSASTPVDAARVRLAARTAEQTFLPLVSRIAKLSEWVEQAVMAVADAKATGVEGEHLADTLRAIARKNGTAYTDIPESVRHGIEAKAD